MSYSAYTKGIAAPRSTQNLVIIEAPGKVKALSAALRRGGLNDFHVIATSGHVYDMPDSLDPVGIDSALNEVGRSLKKPELVNQIREWALKAERVLIACDADQEGDVLALDIARAIDFHSDVRRIRLRSLDAQGVVDAFAHPEPVNPRDAWPGTARRILDRLIGATFSRPQANAMEAANRHQDDAGGMDRETTQSSPLVSAGRIQSGLLGAASRNRIPMARATLSLRACDKRDPFIAVLDVFPENRERVMELVELCKEYERSGDCVKLGPVQAAENFQPWSYGEAVLAVARATDRKIDAVSQSMQRLYEGGRMSYPRSSASAVTGDGLASISKIADANGVRFDPSKLPMFSRTQRHAHESPRPISGQVDISSPLLVLSNDEATLSLLARHLLACGQPHAIHRPDPNALPQWARGIVFERKVCQWLRPWPRRPASPGVRELPIEEAAMELLITNGLGRPSTLVNHAIKFASRGLLDSTMSLTDKAREWISGTPQVLLDVTTSKRIEALIDQSAERDDPDSAPPRLVRSILDHFGLWQDVSPKLEHSGSGLVSAASLQDR